MDQKNNSQNGGLKSIQEVSQLFDIPKSTLRYYEEVGLLHSQRDPDSNYRKYSLLSIIELSDIILYRNLALSIKEIQDIIEMPISATKAVLEQASADTEKEMEKLRHILQEIDHRKQRIEQYDQLRQQPMRVVERPGLRRVLSWDQYDPDSMAAYIQNPYTTPYVIYLPDLGQPETVLEGLSCGDNEGYDHTCLWQAPAVLGRYLECMVRTSYAYLDMVGLGETLDGIRARGFAPLSLIGEYLTSDVDPGDGKKYDYFRAWIELR